MVAALALLLYPVVSDNLYYQNMIILSLVFAIGAVGLNVISGYGGYISLGQGAFLGLGAYTLAILSTRVDVSVWVWVPVAGLVAGLFAALLGVIALRTRGPAFVIMTIAFLFLLQIVATNWSSLTGGTAGITLPLPTWSIDIQNWPFYYSLAALLGALAADELADPPHEVRDGPGGHARGRGQGGDGRRQHARSTSCSGSSRAPCSSAWRARSTATTSRSSTRSGCSTSCSASRSCSRCCSAAAGTLFGPVLGAFLIEPLNEWANNDLGGGNSRLLIFGGLMALVVLFLPRGIIPTLRDLIEARRQRGKAGIVGARLELRERPQLPPRPEPTGRALLEVKGLEKRFGGLRAVDGASFSVPEGSITALIGPNGSGKTTVFNLIGGTMAQNAGEVWFDGRRIDGLKPWERAYAGLGRTFQITRLFREMTVLENVVAPLRGFRWRQLNADGVSGSEAERAEELLDFVGMKRYAGVQAKRALVRAAEARRARAGADARPEADPARRARRRHQPDADRADGRHDPRAQRAAGRRS